jgi:hypothetical protein
MSLMQLLTVGHSFMDVKDEPSPYRVNRRGLLPRFVATPGNKNLVTGSHDGLAVEKTVKLENFRVQEKVLMTPETRCMASAASEATIPASSEFVVEAAALAPLAPETHQNDVVRPRVKLREGQSGDIPGMVVVKQKERKVFKKLGLGRLYWPAWMFSSAVVEPNRRRGLRTTSSKAVHVVRNTLSLSDVEIVATPANEAGRRGWKEMPSKAWNWLTGSWRGKGSTRRS